MRITKDSEERKNEILDVAEKLFAKNGIANTAVSAIVKEINVAQGLFYYYFKSKDDVVDEIVKRYNNDFKKNLDKSIKENEFDKQLEAFVSTLTKSFNDFWDKYGEESSSDIIQLTAKSIEDFKKTASSELEKIIKKGNDDEKLNIKSPEYYAKAIVGGISDLVAQGMNDIDKMQEIVDELLKKEKNNE